MELETWRIDQGTNPDRATDALQKEPAWTAYALGNLEPPFAEYTNVELATSSTGRQAACMTLRHPAFTWIISTGPMDGVAALLDVMKLPREASVSIRDDHIAAFQAHFAFPDGWTPMRRMSLDGGATMPVAGAGPQPVLLGRADLRDIEDLYDAYTESSFTADHLERGVFFGIRDENGLVAAAGTHVVSEAFSIAAIGSVFTLPGSRGNGFATVLTAAVVQELRGRGIETIVLNVATENITAGRIYERLGFRDFCAFYEAQAVLRNHG